MRAWRASASLRPGAVLAAHLALRHPAQRGHRPGSRAPGASPARRRRPRREWRAATTSIDRVLTTWQVEAALAAARRRPSAGAGRGALARAGPTPRSPHDLGVPDRHREEPRLLRPARAARRARGPGVARWLSIQPACAEWREHLAAWLVAQVGPGRRGRAGRAPGRLRQVLGGGGQPPRGRGDLARRGPGGEPWRPATDAAPPADLADRIVARVATERRGRRFRRAALALMATRRRGGGARRRRDAR